MQFLLTLIMALPGIIASTLEIYDWWKRREEKPVPSIRPCRSSESNVAPVQPTKNKGNDIH